MPYSKSRARTEFESSSIRLKRLAKAVSYASSPLTYDHKQLINQSCIFLLSARIEDYTKSLIEDLIYNYRIHGATLRDIPGSIRTKALLDSQVTHYRNYYNSSDEKKILNSISVNSPSYNLVNDGVTFTNQIHPSNIIGTNKYPSLQNLKILYHRIGIHDITEKLNIRSRKDLKTALASFLSLRESIAHQGAAAITFIDVQRHFGNINEIINHIDRIVYSHITKESGPVFWT